jgi:rubredoxin
MSVKCKGCGFAYDNDAAAKTVMEIWPATGTGGGGHYDWITEFLAKAMNKNAVECPTCKQKDGWEGSY